MAIQGVQLLLLGFVLFMVYVLYLHWRKKDISHLMFGGWIIIWTTFTVLIIFPKILEPFLHSLFVVKVMDFLMVLSFMVLTYVTVESNIKIKNFEEKLEKVVRKLADR